MVVLLLTREFMKSFLSHIVKIIKCKRNPIKFFKKRGVKFGDNVRIYSPRPELFSTEPWLVSIGNNVYIGVGVQFLTHDMGTLLFPEKNFVICGNINVGNNVVIGMDAMIMPGVNIGNNVIIGARAVVTKDIKDNLVVAGVPARVVGTYKEYSAKIDSIKNGQYTRYWNNLDDMHSRNPNKKKKTQCPR